jgi:hypothetical protein
MEVEPTLALRNLMPRYHFDLVDSVVIKDLGGRLCENDAHAKSAANSLASELFETRPDLHGLHYKVVVNDAEGRLIHNAAIDRIGGLEFPADLS